MTRDELVREVDALVAPYFYPTEDRTAFVGRIISLVTAWNAARLREWADGKTANCDALQFVPDAWRRMQDTAATLRAAADRLEGK